MSYQKAKGNENMNAINIYVHNNVIYKITPSDKENLQESNKNSRWKEYG